jgi:D-aminopeptidase
MCRLLALLATPLVAASLTSQPAPRARDLHIAPGVFTPGPFNAITDVAGLRVGQVTLSSGDKIRTGVTAIIPHTGNAYAGFGKLAGSTQVNELGELETPILLTCTLCVWKAADAMVEWMLAMPGMERVRSLNPVVGETNDGTLNDIRARPITAEDVKRALNEAKGGAVAEGGVGAGTGTVAFGWKGGIGTSSRVLPASLGGYTVGVLVQSNFGGVLNIMGAPVGKELGQYAFKNETTRERGDGSVIVVVATDAPLSDRNLRRVAARTMMGLGRTGSSASNGSGDYAIAFSTAKEVRRAFDATRHSTTELANEEMSAIFQAVVEATEESVYNSMIAAKTTTGNGRTIEALPLDKVREILARYGIR